MTPILIITLLGGAAALFRMAGGRNLEAEREHLASVKAWKLTFGDVTPDIRTEILSLLSQMGSVHDTTPVDSSVLSLVWYPDLRQASRWEFPAKRWPSNLVSQDPHA